MAKMKHKTETNEMIKEENNSQKKNNYMKVQIVLGILAFLVAVGGIAGMVIGASQGVHMEYLLLFSVIIALTELLLGTSVVIITIKAYRPKDEKKSK